MRHVKVCSLVTLVVIALLLAVAYCGREAEAQSPLSTASPLIPLCPTPTPPPNPVTVTGFEASSPADNLYAFAFGIVFTVIALVVAAWWWLWVKGKGATYPVSPPRPEHIPTKSSIQKPPSTRPEIGPTVRPLRPKWRKFKDGP